MRILLLDNIRSMNNVGAIFRSADGAGWDRIVLTGYTPTPPRKEIDKTALGAQNSVAWEYYEDPLTALQCYRKLGYIILAAEKNDTSIDYKNAPFKTHDSNVMLIVGNEVDGIQESLLQAVDHVIHLPMRGKKSSLNVAVASGILMYHFSGNT